MALYVYAREYVYKSSYLFRLNLTNDPETYFPDRASFFREYEPNMATFPTSIGLEAERSSITQIAFNNAETSIKLPEDCSGLFKNLRLGQEDRSSSAWYWTQYPSDISYYRMKDFVIDLSRFDTSDVKNMSSMFENCVGPLYDIYSTGSGSYGELKEYNGPNNFQFSGLDAWDVSNVENVSRMFANINMYSLFQNGPGYDRFNAAKLPFISGGINNWVFTKVTDASSMFAGSTMDVSGMNIQFKNADCDYSFMFSNFKTKFSYYSGLLRYTFKGGDPDNKLDLTTWEFTGGGSTYASMFRNTGLTKIIFGSTMNKAIATLTSDDAINYMFANDGSINKGELKTISVKAGSDWHTINPLLSGYKMFINDTGLPNFNSVNNDIHYANNTKTTGYFEQSPPEKVSLVYFYVYNKGWMEADPWIKTENGWKESEVYY